MARREASGKVQRERDFSAAAKRAQIFKFMLQPEWGTVCGVLFLREKITDVEYQAAKKWDLTIEAYRSAICQPGRVKTLGMEVGIGHHEPDPDSVDGLKLADRDRKAAERFNAAHEVLKRSGKFSALSVRAAVEQGEYPAGYDALQGLKVGLSALAAHWNLTNQGKHGVR